MRAIVTCIALLLATPSLRLQSPSLSIQSQTAVGVYVIKSGIPYSSSIPASTPLVFNIAKAEKCSLGFCVTASLGVVFGLISVSGDATYGDEAGTTTSGGSYSPHSYRVTVSGAGTTTVGMTLRGSSSGPAMAGISVGAPFNLTHTAGNPPLTGGTSVTLPVSFVVTVHGRATFGGRYNAWIEFSLGGLPCAITPYGGGCGPMMYYPRNTVEGGQRRITLNLVNGLRNAFGLLVFGSTRTAIALPGTACFLETDPGFVIPFTTDGIGGATLQLVRAVGPWSVNLDTVLFTGLLDSFPSGPALELRCP
jgi:hypothetical protein